MFELPYITGSSDGGGFQFFHILGDPLESHYLRQPECDTEKWDDTCYPRLAIGDNLTQMPSNKAEERKTSKLRMSGGCNQSYLLKKGRRTYWVEWRQ